MQDKFRLMMDSKAKTREEIAQELKRMIELKARPVEDPQASPTDSGESTPDISAAVRKSVQDRISSIVREAIQSAGEESYGEKIPPRETLREPGNSVDYLSGSDTLSKDQCCQYLTRVGLCANDYLDREVDVSLSGGEVKRIEIATLLARNAELMIFDEPEAGIDLWSFARLTETFQQIHDQGRATMVIISHQERIISLADEVVVVGGGEIRHRGSANDILPQILADTLGACPVLARGGEGA